MTHDGGAQIEVGQVADPSGPEGGGLRLWRAREALRQAEQRLQAQAAALTTLESRAQALVGWATPLIIALVGAFFLTSMSLELRAAAAGAAVSLGLALFFAVLALAPGDWAVVGHDPNKILSLSHSAELFDVEAMAAGYADGIANNTARLEAASKSLRDALKAAACAPLIALAAAAAVAAMAALMALPA